MKTGLLALALAGVIVVFTRHTAAVADAPPPSQPNNAEASPRQASTAIGFCCVFSNDGAIVFSDSTGYVESYGGRFFWVQGATLNHERGLFKIVGNKPYNGQLVPVLQPYYP